MLGSPTSGGSSRRRRRSNRPLLEDVDDDPQQFSDRSKWALALAVISLAILIPILVLVAINHHELHGAGADDDDNGSPPEPDDVFDDDDYRFRDDVKKGSWPQYGGPSMRNTRTGATTADAEDIEQLRAACVAQYVFDWVDGSSNSTPASPVIVDDVLYWVGQGAYVGASRLPKSANGIIVPCEELWRRYVPSLLGIAATSPGASIRVSPAYYKREDGTPALLYVGPSSAFDLSPSDWNTTRWSVIVLEAETGDTIDVVPITPTFNEDNSYQLQSSLSGASIYGRTAYFGLASVANAIINGSMTARGSIYAFDIDELEVKWSRRTLPPPPAGWMGEWFSGAGVWTSNPSVCSGCDPDTGDDLVYFGTGQLYGYPDFVRACMNETVNITGPTFNATLKGETWAGMEECLEEAETYMTGTLGIDLSDIPLLVASAFAVNARTGEYVWYHQTNGIDAWTLFCGTFGLGDPCHLDTAGPDWDVGGSAPIVYERQGRMLVQYHNKGGIVFYTDAATGEVLRTIDVCSGGTLGGLHFGIAYDPDRGLTLGSCSGALPLLFSLGIPAYREILADGEYLCGSGHGFALDVDTGDLVYQVVPFGGVLGSENGTCLNATVQSFLNDPFKYERPFDRQYTVNPTPGVPVHYLPDSPLIPLQPALGAATMHAVPISVPEGITFFSALHGTVYAVDTDTGELIKQFHCAEGGLYGPPAIAETTVNYDSSSPTSELSASSSSESDSDEERQIYLGLPCGYQNIFGDFVAGASYTVFGLRLD